MNLSSVDTTSKILDLTKRLRAKEFKKRRLGRVPFEIGKDVTVGCSFYCLINKAKKPTGI
jgi:hypothetical protein